MDQNIPFNHTFTSDKPIIYPSTWQTGKNAAQLFEQFKETVSYIIMKNAIEYILGGIWIFLIYVIISALIELRRLNKLSDESRQKMANRNYLKKKFLISVGFLTFVIICGSIAILIVHQGNKYVLLKGVGTWIVILTGNYVWKNFIKNRRSKKMYQRVSLRQQ